MHLVKLSYPDNAVIGESCVAALSFFQAEVACHIFRIDTQDFIHLEICELKKWRTTAMNR